MASRAMTLSGESASLTPELLALAAAGFQVRIAEAALRTSIREARRTGHIAAYDPGRERRAEQRARELLKSCVNEEEWAMYRDLGFIRVWGGEGREPSSKGPGRDLKGVPYAYLIYAPGLMILLTTLAVNFLGDGLRDAFDPQSGKL